MWVNIPYMDPLGMWRHAGSFSSCWLNQAVKFDHENPKVWGHQKIHLEKAWFLKNPPSHQPLCLEHPRNTYQWQHCVWLDALPTFSPTYYSPTVGHTAIVLLYHKRWPAGNLWGPGPSQCHRPQEIKAFSCRSFERMMVVVWGDDGC